MKLFKFENGQWAGPSDLYRKEDAPALQESPSHSKLQWYGHVSRPLGLAKAVLRGTVQGGRRQGRQRKRWEDNTRKWTGLELGRF